MRGMEMKLEWMGRYRDIIGRLMRYGNLYARAYAVSLSDDTGIAISSLEWQTLECILEHEDENHNMSILAGKMGVPQSNFSKYVKTLLAKELVERFQKDSNNKDIILKLTNRGRELYQIRSRNIATEWQDVFETLDGFSDEQIALFSLFVEKLSESFDPNKTKPTKLIKVSAKKTLSDNS